MMEVQAEHGANCNCRNAEQQQQRSVTAIIADDDDDDDDNEHFNSGSTPINNTAAGLASGHDDDDFTPRLVPKMPRREASLSAYGSDAAIINRNEEITLKMHDNVMRDTLLYRLNTFRRNRELCDIVLFVHEKEILAHKVVLAACSPALMDMFIGSENEKTARSSNNFFFSSTPPQTATAKLMSGQKLLSANSSLLTSTVNSILPAVKQPLSYYEFAEADYDCFEAIVNYTYTSDLEISSKKVGELYKTAHALQVIPVANACAHYLVENLNTTDCIGIRRQANINDDMLVEHVDNFIAKNFAQIVDESKEFTLLPCIKLRVILSISDTKRLSCGEDIARRALQYFQTLPHASDRVEQWIEQLVEKTHMLYLEADATLQDCSEMDDHSSVGASDIIQDYKRTGGYLPRTYSGSNALEVQTPAHHVTGATPVHINTGHLSNTKLSSAESNSSLSSSTEHEDESYKLIAVHQTAGDFWIALAVFHRRLVTLSIQLSEAENVVKSRTVTQDAKVSMEFETQEQKTAGEEAVARLISSTSSLRTPLPEMKSPRCSVGGAYMDGKIIVCGGYDRGKCLKSVEEYNLFEGAWRCLPDMSQCRGRFDAAVVADKVYAVAGSNGAVDLKTVECYDTKTGKWSPVKSLQKARSHNGCAALDGYVYCIGGSCEQDVLDRCERYSPQTDEWTAVTGLRTARFQAGCTSWLGFVVVCGGSDGWKCLNSVEIYDPKTGIWQDLAPLKTARRGCAVAAVKNSLFVIGGHDGTHSLNSVEVLDSLTGEWRSGPSITTPRANIRAVVTPGNEIYLLGGFDGIQFLASIEVLSTESLGWRSWQQVKKLSVQEKSYGMTEDTPEKFENAEAV